MALQQKCGEVMPLAGCGTESEGGDTPAPRSVTLRSLALFGFLAVGLLVVAALAVRGGESPVDARGEHLGGIVNLNSKAFSDKDGELAKDAHEDTEQEAEDDGEEEKEEKEPTEKTETKDEKDKKDDEPDYSKCSWGKQDCNSTRCCNNPGHQCYQQTEWYSQCRPDCKEGVDPTHWDSQKWSCNKLGERAMGDVVLCSSPGEDCRETNCCSAANSQCYEKNKDWATCKTECQEGAPDMTDSNGDPWTCKALGDRKQGPPDWVAQECTAEGEECSETQCCASPGMQCYRQSEFWAQCKYDCQAKDPDQPWAPDWSCEELGSRTPGMDGPPPGALQPWVLDACVDEGVDCHVSKCCLGNNMQCYAKNKEWAMCMDDCQAGVHAEDGNSTWSCEPLGPRLTQGLAIKGSPSLFCWSLFQTTTYEMGIMQLQLKLDAGIFQCDEWALLSTDAETVLGKTVGGKEAKTEQVEMAEITTSVDGTAGNAQLFINCWKVIADSGRWKHHAWIIKVDPDAVIVAPRVRDHLRSHSMESVYVVNCNAFPSSPNFPMMYGSVEIFSYLAIDAYAQNGYKCIEDMGMMLPKWGEDYFMTHCLDHIGVGRISDFTSVGDNVCSGGSCADQAFSAFHPFKSKDAWHNCWDLAMGYITPPPNPWD